MPGTTVFSVSLSIDSTNISSRSATTECIDLTTIPEDYHEFQDVFSKSKASKLVPHHPYDLKIDLEEGAVPLIRRMYPLSETKLQVLHDFLDEHLCTGFVRPSNSLHGTPIIFAKKKDGTLRLCVDFRGLNCLSKKDHYPLPLIADLLDAPSKAQIYMLRSYDYLLVR
jgi:hypothetical protein